MGQDRQAAERPEQPTLHGQRGVPERGPYIVRRVAIPGRGATPGNSWLRARHLLPGDTRARAALGYLGAVAGVAAATGVIALIHRAVFFKNISLIYLLVVLWLAAVFGRGPAILASCLSFVAYDYFFIQPLHVLTVSDPTEWLSLFALLATSLVLGQHTAAIQARAREARESQARTATLYAASQLIVSTQDQQRLLELLAERMVAVFRSGGVEACAIVLPDERDQAAMGATFPAGGPLADALSLARRERQAQAATALHQGSAGGSAVAVAREDAEQDGVAFYLPLKSTRGIVGALGVAGSPALRRLVAGFAPALSPALASGTATPQPVVAAQDPQVTLFAAFCDQIALALDQIALRREIIHTEVLRESDQLKTALLGSVTHDLRTPLAAIQAAAGSLLDESTPWSEAERRAFAETIESSAERLTRLVSNLLDLSRLEAGVLVPERRWYPLADVIAPVLDRLELAGHTAGCAVTVDLPDDLPLAFIDHAQIEQVLTNLIENAIKYSPPTAPIAVRARALAEPPALEVRVVDRGIGIPSGEARAIFDKFYRVQHVELPWSSGRPPTGTGLGLAICAGIIQAHGGRIWAEGTPGGGATLAFTLPLPAEGGAAPSSQALREQPDSPAPVAPAHSGRKERGHA